MKYASILFVLVLVSGICSADTITLTDEQYRNIGILAEKIKAKYPQFKGFNGSREKMEVVGLSGSAVSAEIKNINLLEIETENYEIAQEVSRVKEKMVDLAILEAGKDKVLKHTDKVKAALLEKVSE